MGFILARAKTDKQKEILSWIKLIFIVILFSWMAINMIEGWKTGYNDCMKNCLLTSEDLWTQSDLNISRRNFTDVEILRNLTVNISFESSMM